MTQMSIINIKRIYFILNWILKLCIVNINYNIIWIIVFWFLDYIIINKTGYLPQKLKHMI